MPKLVQAAPILEVKDVRASEAFYRQKLGFRPGLFVGERPDREPEDQPYGCRDFDIRDPDGRLIGIGQNERSAAGRLTLPYA